MENLPLESLHFIPVPPEKGGVTWNIDKNSSPLNPRSMASGAIENLGQRGFLYGGGGDSLLRVDVKAGDMIYLVVGPRGDYRYDSTRVDLRIRSNFVKGL